MPKGSFVMEHAKPYDTGQPRNGTIFFYAILTLVLLGLLDFALRSYFGKMMDAEYHQKVAIRGLEQVENMRAKETATLQKTGLDRAMQSLAQRGRTGSTAIAPESGAGKAAVTGWTQLRPAPAPTAEAPVPAVGPTTSPGSAIAPGTGPTPKTAPVPGEN
jgi:hypothetical protein